MKIDRRNRLIILQEIIRDIYVKLIAVRVLSVGKSSVLFLSTLKLGSGQDNTNGECYSIDDAIVQVFSYGS